MKIKILTITTIIAVLFLAGCPGGPTDADLQKSAGDALKAEATTSNLTVAVKEGVATITGEVKDDAAKAKAEELVKAIKGVKSVTNSVTVKAPPKASADDGPLKTKVEEALKKVKCEGATVEVKDGKVTLRGKVKADVYPKCIQAVNEAKPKDVDNQLAK